MSKDNCACNTQAFYADRQCTNHSTTGYPGLKIPQDTIDLVKSGETILASNFNQMRDSIRTLVRKYNDNKSFVEGRGRKIIYRQHAYLTASSTISAHTFNNLLYMGLDVGAHNVNGHLNAGDTVTTEDWLKLINSFNDATENCLCNTDCSCNTVCSVVSDCGCNYS